MSMFNSNFPETNFHFEAQTNPNLNPNYTNDYLDFDIYLYDQESDNNYWLFAIDQPSNNEDSTSSFSNASLSQSPVIPEMTISTGSVDSSLEALPENPTINQRVIRAADDNDSEDHRVVTFRIKTDLEILDDGYKWRKYGKKKVKSNSNPRNYYKCSSERCRVKKRVERDPKDSSYVITSYEGVHNHQTLTHHHIISAPSSHPFTLHSGVSL